jgi:hypothetical protein
MIAMRRHRVAIADERGSILVVATLICAVFVLLGSAIIEIGHTMAHRRHLQVQTDAAALAAAQDFSLCSTDPGSAYGAMTVDADKYGGFAAGSFNQQVGTANGYAGNITRAYQSRTYPAGSHPQDPDNIFSGDTTLMTCGDPSVLTSAKFFDVKATEVGVHNVFDFGLSSTVNAHSRVELKAVNEATGILPLAVPDVRPQFVFAKFIAESGTISCTGQTDPNLDACEEELVRDATDTAKWIPKGTLLNVTVPTGDLSIQMRLVGGSNKYATCGTLFVDCYIDGSTTGLVHVRGWNAAATAPLVKDAALLNGTCSPDAYFTQADCSAGITADIDLGATHPVEQSQVWATVDGGGTYPLSTAGTGTGIHTWTLAQGIPITGAGPHPIQLNWSWLDPSCKGSVSKCTTTGNFFGNQLIQRAFEASPDLSGPLQSAQIYKSGSSFGPYSYQGGTTQALGVTIRTTGVLLLSQPSDPPISLRVFKGGKSAAQDQTVDCDAQANLKLWEELHFGCTPWYQTIQPPNPLNCDAYPDTMQKNWGPQPWHCVPVITGDRNAQIGKGLNLRIFNDPSPGKSACSSGMVHWIKPGNETPTDPKAGFNEKQYPDDKRVLPLFVTPFGSFGGSGNANVPLIDFGYFYVTGYSGDPCSPANGDPNDDSTSPLLSGGGGKAFVLGHFIKYFPIDAQHHPSDNNCDLTTITPCVGVLTR